MFPDGRDLVARVKRDPDAALSSLTEKYGQQLYDYCVTMVADPDVASNAVAGALLAATRRIADLPDPRDFDVWLFSLARAECLLLLQLAPDRLRRRPPSVAAVADESDDTTGSGPEQSPHDGQPVDVALVRQGLATLSVGDREVLVLQRGCGFDADQISQIMGVTPANATHRLERAGDHLAEAVAAQVLLHDPPGSCDALDALVGGSTGADAMGLRRLIAAHVADCPWCAERVVDVRPVYASAEAGPRVYRSDSDAVAGIRQRLADAAPTSRGPGPDPTSSTPGIPQPGVAVAGSAASKSAGQPARKRRWWLPASALVLLAGGGLAFAIADRPAGVSDVAADAATGGSLQPALESSVRTWSPVSPATASATPSSSPSSTQPAEAADPDAGPAPAAAPTQEFAAAPSPQVQVPSVASNPPAAAVASVPAPVAAPVAVVAPAAAPVAPAPPPAPLPQQTATEAPPSPLVSPPVPAPVSEDPPSPAPPAPAPPAPVDPSPSEPTPVDPSPVEPPPADVPSLTPTPSVEPTAEATADPTDVPAAGSTE